MAEGRRLRIGELSRRVGVSPELLRAWETRYGLMRPDRTPGGLRLFSEEDERRVRRMRRHIAEGLPASEAARLAKQQDDPSAHESSDRLTEIQMALEHGSDALDEAAVQAAFDHLFKAVPLQTALSEVILPFLHRLGNRWATAQTSVTHEHFASNVIGGRLRGLTRGWGNGVGPLAILACAPGELHDLGLLCFGLALREHGWRITYLGADTPLHDLAHTIGELPPTIVVLCATNPDRFLDAGEEITALRRRVRVGIGGAGATSTVADELGVELLDGDAIGQAARLAP